MVSHNKRKHPNFLREIINFGNIKERFNTHDINISQ